MDEAMIKFQGRSSLKQYMPLKPIERGIKVWVLGDSSNGYFSRMDIHTGRKDKTEHGLGASVKQLPEDFQNSWRYVFFDNFFTSKSLLLDLLQVGIYGCGTARSHRKGFPEQLKKPKLKQRYELPNNNNNNNNNNKLKQSIVIKNNNILVTTEIYSRKYKLKIMFIYMYRCINTYIKTHIHTFYNIV